MKREPQDSHYFTQDYTEEEKYPYTIRNAYSKIIGYVVNKGDFFKRGYDVIIRNDCPKCRMDIRYCSCQDEKK